MKMRTITKIIGREILDSRGNPTIEVDVFSQYGMKRASVPSGASTGKYEAVEKRDGGDRYNGLGVKKSINICEKKIGKLIEGINLIRQREIDNLMIERDGKINKSRFGANSMLAVSIAVARHGAEAEGMRLFEYINELLAMNKKLRLPRPFFNVINGGKHAGNDLPIQEFMISPRANSYTKALEMGSEIYHALKEILIKKYGKNAINVGDEGGFAPPIKKAEQALDLLLKAITKAGYKGKVDIAMDCAASEFYKNGYYFVPIKKSNDKLLEYYLKLIKKYPIISIEDPFYEDDFESFAKLREKTKILIVGDDLLVTNVKRIKKAIDKKSCNCLLLKPNQIGTVSETLDAVRLAYENGWEVMVSHRSGETEDSFISDLAVGIGATMIKAGAPCRGERVSKYNRLLRIQSYFSRKV